MKNNVQKTIIILVIIFFYPLGIPLMFATKTFTLKTRLIITFSFLIAIVIGLLSIILWTSSPGYIH